MRGYNQLEVNAGEIDTPKDLVIPESPNNHTTKLFAKAPKHPAAKKINTFFIVLSPDIWTDPHELHRSRCGHNSSCCPPPKIVRIFSLYFFLLSFK